MIITELSSLPMVNRRAVIINFNTRWVATLALLSALRYVEMPVLVIDCESKDGSWDHFKKLMAQHEFDLVSAPLKPHGHTLDWLFRNLPAETILLIDSDTETLNRDYLKIMEHAFEDPRVFGAGFIHSSGWMTKLQFGFDHEKLGLYQERMWIPFSLLKTAKIREALDAGRSFIDRTIYNDFPLVPRISRWLHRRFHKKALVRARWDFLNPFRRIYGNGKPSYVYCDTGADVFQYLRYERDYQFAGISAELHGKYVSHFHGITRKIIEPNNQNAAALDDVVKGLFGRLRDIYGITPTMGEK